MNRTTIEYLTHTLNVTSGCNGEGCAIRQCCWAASMAKRLRGRYGYPTDNPFQVTFHKDRLDQPFKVKTPCRIGLCYMGDLFDREVKVEWQEAVFSMVEKAPQHTFLSLTKQPQNIPFRYIPDNLQLGVTVNVQADLWRIDELLRHPAKVHYLSCEPLKEELADLDLHHIEWVIIGAQTRPQFQPRFSWVADILDKTAELQIPVFMKENLGYQRLLQEFPEEA